MILVFFILDVPVKQIEWRDIPPYFDLPLRRPYQFAVNRSPIFILRFALKNKMQGTKYRYDLVDVVA